MEQLKNLKKQLTEAWKNFESRFSESHGFNLLKEKYQSLNIGQQKLIKYSSVIFVLIILTYFPVSYFLSSTVYWGEFQEKQNLSLDLLKMRNKIYSSVLRYSQDQLKDRMERLIEKYTTSSFQITDRRIVFPKGDSVYQVDFNIQLDHLNIKQAVRLGTELHNLPQSRLSAVTMEENKEFPKHYDVKYKLSSFVSKEGKASSSRRLPPSKNIPLKNQKEKPRTLEKNERKDKDSRPKLKGQTKSRGDKRKHKDEKRQVHNAKLRFPSTSDSQWKTDQR